MDTHYKRMIGNEQYPERVSIFYCVGGLRVPKLIKNTHDRFDFTMALLKHKNGGDETGLEVIVDGKETTSPAQADDGQAGILYVVSEYIMARQDPTKILDTLRKHSLEGYAVKMLVCGEKNDKPKPIPTKDYRNVGQWLDNREREIQISFPNIVAYLTHLMIYSPDPKNHYLKLVLRGDAEENKVIRELFKSKGFKERSVIPLPLAFPRSIQ